MVIWITYTLMTIIITPAEKQLYQCDNFGMDSILSRMFRIKQQRIQPTLAWYWQNILWSQ